MTPDGKIFLSDIPVAPQVEDAVFNLRMVGKLLKIGWSIG
jgi:hypothetical protein